jgi:hypothetical protein
MTTQTTEMAAGELARIVNAAGLVPANAQTLIDAFAPLAQQADALVRDAKGIEVTDATQVSAMREAYKQRRAIASVRIDAEKVRVAQKADYMKMSKVIDGIGRYIAGMCEPEEARLLECEKFAERAEAARIDATRKARAATLHPIDSDLSPALVTYPDLGAMTEAAFHAFEDERIRLRAGRDADRERVAREAREAREAEAAERQRIAEENARLKAERDAAEAARVEAEKAARAERERADAEARRQQAAAAKKLAAERAERERLQREADARDAAEVARQQAEKAEAQRQAAAPDADKLRHMAAEIEAIMMPGVSTDAAVIAARRIKHMLGDVAKAARDMADGLGGAR